MLAGLTSLTTRRSIRISTSWFRMPDIGFSLTPVWQTTIPLESISGRTGSSGLWLATKPTQKLASAYQYNKDKNSLDEVGTMGVFETDKRDTVFTAATVNWVLGLCQEGTGGVIDQITWNVFDRLG